MLSDEVADKVTNSVLGYVVEEVSDRVIEQVTDEVSARLAQELPILKINHISVHESGTQDMLRASMVGEPLSSSPR